MLQQLRLDFAAREPPESTVIVGFPGAGMSAVSANQYLIEQLELAETGHIHAEGLPAFMPYSEGRPYHATRLFSGIDVPVTLLSSEMPIPMQFSEAFGRTVLEWIEDRDVEEVTVLSGIPSLELDDGLHYVASEDYVQARLEDGRAQPLSGGFLTGINASLVDRGLDTDLRVGVLATGVNPYRPLDPGAAVQLVEGVSELYGFDVDTAQLREFADRTRQHYEELIAQIQAQEQPTTVPRDDYGFM